MRQTKLGDRYIYLKYLNLSIRCSPVADGSKAPMLWAHYIDTSCFARTTPSTATTMWKPPTPTPEQSSTAHDIKTAPHTACDMTRLSHNRVHR